MSWRFWTRESPEEPQPPAAEDPDTAPEFDLNALLESSLPEPPVGEDPEWLAEDPNSVVPDATRRIGEAYTRVDYAELRRMRARREAERSWWARARRGELTTADLPGQAALARGFFALAHKMISPLLAIVENPGVVVAVILTCIAFAGGAWGLLELVRYYFGPLM